jgi:CRISPR/Cas system-associated exonuclease Cas4 (RecB family)
MRDDQPETVTASEIAEYVYCPEAWRLSATGAPSANRPERDAGTIHHARKAAAEVTAGRSIAIGRILILIALLALAMLWAISR